MPFSRRTYLSGLASAQTVGFVSLAGCLGGNSGRDGSGGGDGGGGDGSGGDGGGGNGGGGDGDGGGDGGGGDTNEKIGTPSIDILEKKREDGGIEVIVDDSEDDVQQTGDGFYIEDHGYINGEKVFIQEPAPGYGFYNGTPISEMEDRKLAYSRWLIPDDGFMDVYIIAWIENFESETDSDPYLRANIYLDQEFRDGVEGPINIAWGPDFEGNFRPYEFNEISAGVYKDTVIDRNINRLVSGDGGVDILVGNLTEKGVEERKFEGYTLVFVR